MTDDQLAFDIEGMLHQARVEAAPEWTGTPLHFTTDYYSPDELDAALEHWQFLHARDETHTTSRMWRRSITVPESAQLGRHGFVLYTTDLRCDRWQHPDRKSECMCLGDLMYQAICEPCQWNGIADQENDAVELWHDHALPGWRELPIVPFQLLKVTERGLSDAAKKWISEHYPDSMQVPGAPVITERRPFGTRHVPSRSPWGGYDLSYTAVDPDRAVEASTPKAQSKDRVLEPRQPQAAPPAVGLGD